jgi:phosphoglycolate phosphatase (TIGR01487 family)
VTVGDLSRKEFEALRSRKASAIVQIFVFDYDGTLTVSDTKIPETTQAALKQFKAKTGSMLGIVSGRELPFLRQVNNLLSGLFSFLVAENGAVTLFADSDQELVKGREWSERARMVFSKADFHIRFAEVIGSSKREETEKITSILRDSRFEAKLVPNKDSLMVLPPNVDKGIGVSDAVAHYATTKDIHLTCFGDGENDIALFGPADTRVAVSNAVEELKKIADYVTKKPGGYGVEEYLEGLLGKNNS